MKKSSKKSVIVSAMLAIAMSASVAAGATYAIFTSESSTNIAITSGMVDVKATISDFKAYTPKSITKDGTITDDTNIADNSESVKKFGNVGAGTAEYDESTNQIKLNGVMPGDKVTFTITITNYSNIKTQYRTSVVKSAGSDEDLYGALDFTVGGMSIAEKSSWYALEPVTDKNGVTVAKYECSVELPSTVAGSNYMNKSCALSFNVEAVQGNTDTAEYAEGITAKGFEEAQNVQYTNNLGQIVTGNKPAVAAYINSEGQAQYVGDMNAAILGGAKTVYCKENVTLRMRERLADTNRTPDLTDDLTIYGNGADFQSGDISMNMTQEGKAANITLKVYDAKNIKVWGGTPNNDVTQTVYMENCHNEGEIATGDKGIMMYLVGSTGTINATVKNCYIAKNSSGIYMSTNGSLTVLNSTFVECAAGIKSSYKGNGTRTDRIENCTFIKCGCTTEMQDEANKGKEDKDKVTWLAEDSAAIKCKISSGATGTMKVSLKDNVFTGTIGDKGDVRIAPEVNANNTVNVSEKEDVQQAVSDAISASNVKDVTLNLGNGTNVSLVNGVANEGTKAKNVSFVGELDENGKPTSSVDVVKDAQANAEGGTLNYQRGSSFTFENLVIEAGEGNFDGIVCNELVYKNCTIKGKLTLYGKATFIGCTFENTMENQYSIWTWGGTDVTFEGCTFNTNGKAILLYGQATAEKPTNLVVKDCVFNDRNNGTAGKAAIEIGNDYNATYTLTIENIEVNGFAEGKNTGSKLWANKNSMDAAHLSVTIDKVKVL